MTLAELFTSLKTTGLPVAYREFKSTPENPAPAPPFITYNFTFDNDMKADNINYVGISNIDIELYTDEKDPTTEKLVEAVLKSYSKAEAWIDSEKMIQVIYTIQILGG